MDLPKLKIDAANGDAEAQYQIGLAFLQGTHVPKNNLEAYAWLNVARANGHKKAGKQADKLERSMAPDLVAMAQMQSSTLIESEKLTVRMLTEARDSQRRSDLNEIRNAVYWYVIDTTEPSEDPRLPKAIPLGTAREICASTAKDCSGLVDLRFLEDSYLTSMPTDPKTATVTGTRYFIMQDRQGRLVISAPDAETSAISIIQTVSRRSGMDLVRP